MSQKVDENGCAGTARYSDAQAGAAIVISAMLLPSQVVYSFSSSPAARVGFHITRHLNRMRDHIRTALSLIRRRGILRPYFGKARHLITFLGFLSNPFQSPNLQGQTVSGSQKQNLEKTFI